MECIVGRLRLTGFILNVKYIRANVTRGTMGVEEPTNAILVFVRFSIGFNRTEVFSPSDERLLERAYAPAGEVSCKVG